MFEVDVKNVTEEGRGGGEEGTSSGLGFWFSPWLVTKARGPNPDMF